MTLDDKKKLIGTLSNYAGFLCENGLISLPERERIYWELKCRQNELPETCSDCHGLGRSEYDLSVKCKRCHGTGEQQACIACNGSGYYDGEGNPKCGAGIES